MDAKREDIYKALFALLQKTTGIQNATRKFVTWDKVQKEKMPYLCQVELQEVPEVSGRGIPAVWHCQVDVFVYVSVSDAPEAPAPVEVMNPYIDALEASVSNNPLGTPETLGGLVSQVRLRGTVEKGQDKLGTVGWFVVPLEVVVPA